VKRLPPISAFCARRRALVRLLPAALLTTCFSGVADADIFRIIDDDQEAAQIRVDLIRQAQREILLELFRASDDQMVLSYMALLRDAARRGVKVRFLIDGVFNQLSQPVQAYLIQEGVEIREYHPLRLNKLRWATRRLHDKVLATDRKQMLVGGRNLENPWFGVSAKSYVKKAYVDRDAYVQGTVVEQMHAYFMRLWNSAEIRDAGLGPYDSRFSRAHCDPGWSEQLYESCEEARQRALGGIERARVLLDWHWTQLKQSNFVHLNPGTDWAHGRRDVGEVRFWHNPVARKGRTPGTFQAFLDYLEAARESVLIESPYMILSENSLATFRRLVDRGVKVLILSNSLAATQNFYAQAGYERKKAAWVQLGLQLWEYKGPKMLHAKSVVIDDQIAIVGNFNLDPRSEFLNTELAVVTHDQQIARQLRASIEAHLENAWRIDDDGMPVGEHERFPGSSKGRINKLRFYKLFVPLIEKQL
jgi:putative cardiolipin synthase